MKERPIIMRGDEVRAILEGRKSQTRRVVKRTEGNNVVEFRPIEDGRFEIFEDRYGTGEVSSVCIAYTCPYGVPGDRLWVRETWQIQSGGGLSRAGVGSWDYQVEYRAGGPTKPLTHEGDYTDDPYGRAYDSGRGRWRPSIHMPRWASRLTLEIKSVRVERVQEISEEDARAEGVEKAEATDGALSHALGFLDLWDSINAKRGYGWDTNPWVWCITFERVEQGA